MIDKLKQHLDSITSEQFNKEIEDIQQEFNADGPTMEKFINNQKDLEPEYSELIKDNFWSLTDEPCTTEDCPHCAYERQQEYEAELEKDACIEFAKWLAQDWMSIWVGDKWMWECQTDGIHLGYKTEEELYDLYLKQQ